MSEKESARRVPQLVCLLSLPLSTLKGIFPDRLFPVSNYVHALGIRGWRLAENNGCTRLRVTLCSIWEDTGDTYLCISHRTSYISILLFTKQRDTVGHKIMNARILFSVHKTIVFIL